MSFYEKLLEYRSFDFESYWSSVTPSRIEKILRVRPRKLSQLDYLALLSDAAAPYIERMARKALTLTRSHFGNVIFLFTPLYISNYCENVCAYCSFARQHPIHRRHLSLDEVRNEAERIRDSGIRHILVLTGESAKLADIEYLEKSIRIISSYFSSVAIEIYPLSVENYRRLIASGADGLTMYQETYNQEAYAGYHRGGPKEDFRFRLEAPERACEGGIRAVTVGALFGLYKTRSEAFFTGIHAAHLQKKYPAIEVGMSISKASSACGRLFEPVGP